MAGGLGREMQQVLSAPLLPWATLGYLGPLSLHLVHRGSVLPPWTPWLSYQPKCIIHNSDLNFAFPTVRRCPGATAVFAG